MKRWLVGITRNHADLVSITEFKLTTDHKIIQIDQLIATGSMTFGPLLTWWLTDAISRTIYDLPITQDGRPTRCTTLLLSADGVFLIELLGRNQLAGLDQLRGRRSRLSANTDCTKPKNNKDITTRFMMEECFRR